MATKVLVLGGGSGGLVAANKVKRLLGREVEVTLVDKNAYHEFMPAYPWAAWGLIRVHDVVWLHTPMLETMVRRLWCHSSPK